MEMQTDLIVVDENGDEVDGDQIFGALAFVFTTYRRQLKGDGMVATVMSNQALEDAMNENGLKLSSLKCWR